MVGSRIGIAAAFLVGGVLVTGAFIMGAKKHEAQAGMIVSVPERDHIAIEDANGDGIPDWREALQKTDPIIISGATSSEPYERPKTVTGRFALNFIEDILRSKMYGSFGDTQEELVAGATADLVSASQDTLFTEEDVNITEAVTPDLLRSYGNHIASIALNAKGGSDNEAIILQDALRYNDPNRLLDLEPISASYVDIVKRMLETPVPERYLKEHLDLLNAYNALREDVSAMQKVYDDPLYTFIRMKRYEDDVAGMAYALSQLFDALYLRDKIEWQEGESAAQLKAVIENI